MTDFEVFNHVSAHSFGVFQAKTADAAILACCREAGYDSLAEAEKAMGHASELSAVEVLSADSIASQIMHTARNADAADKRAQELTDTIDQDWGNEATLYTFDDESVLLVSGPQVNAYASMSEARAALDA